MNSIFRIFVYIFAIIGFVLVAVYGAVELGITDESGIVDTQRNYFRDQNEPTTTMTASTATKAFDHISSTEEWKTLEYAIKKDEEIIKKAGSEVGMSPRMIVSILIVEQLRLFHSEREVYKQIFAPLKILGNQSQFSWGVMGIKQDTAKEIESNLVNTSSPYYLGPDFENILSYKAEIDTDEERFARLTNEDDRYYSYLYGAIMAKELIQQWEKAGFPIKEKPGIIATLYNIGFRNSKPHHNPQIGGAVIEINGEKYSFGGLAELFYYSDAMTNIFPHN